MIDELIKIIRPPEVVSISVDSKKMAKIERKLKSKLPDDYWEFIKLYGGGRISGTIVIYSPFDKTEHLNLINLISRNKNTQENIRNIAPELIPFALFPRKKSILLFGGTENGDEIYWYCSSDNPNEWDVIFWQSRSNNYWLFPGGCLEFLLGFLTGRIYIPALSKQMRVHTFEVSCEK